MKADAISLDQRPAVAMRELVLLSLPIIGMMISRMLMGFIDFVMVSQLGTVAQAAISPATIIVFAFACLGMGLAYSVQTFVSQADGRREPEQGGAWAWQSIYLSIVTALCTCPVAMSTPLWYGWFAAAAGHEPEVAALEIQYTTIALWSAPLMVFSTGLNGFFMGVQRPRIAFIAVTVSLVVNFIGNYLLIFGSTIAIPLTGIVLEIPRLEVAGAAYSTVIAWGVRTAVLAAAMFLPEFNDRYRTRRSFAFSLEKFRQMAWVGGPTSVQWLIDIGSWAVFLAVIIPPYGVAALAASNVGLQYMHLSFMPALGIGIALCSQVGYAIGEGKPDRALQRARIAMWLTGGYMGAIGLLFVLAGARLMWLMNDDPAVIQAGVWVLIGAALFQVFDAMCITYMNALRGAGDTRIPAVMIAACCWIIFVGGGVGVTELLEWYEAQRGAPFPGHYRLIAPWLMAALYIILLGIMLRARWLSGQWRKIKLFSATERATSATAEPALPGAAEAVVEPAPPDGGAAVQRSD